MRPERGTGSQRGCCDGRAIERGRPSPPLIIAAAAAAVATLSQIYLDRTIIRQKYLRGWFPIDALSSLPMELIDLAVLAYATHAAGGDPLEVAMPNGAIRMLRALRLVRLLRLLRLLKIQRYRSA